jgi:hypothetical protein
MTESEYDQCSPSKIGDNRNRRRVVTPELSMADDKSYGNRSRRVKFEETKIYNSGEDHSQIHWSTNNSPLKRGITSPIKSHKHKSSMEIDLSQSKFGTNFYGSPAQKLTKTSDQSPIMEKSYYRQNSKAQSSASNLKANFFQRASKGKKSNIKDSTLNYTFEQGIGNQSLLSETFASGTGTDRMPEVSINMPTLQYESGPCYSLFDFIFPMGSKAKYCKLSDMGKINDAVIWDILKKFKFEETPNPVIILSGGRETYREK